MRVSETSKSIYHYTTLNGLLGILNSQCLWCTQYLFMNDSSEVLLFKPRLVELLIPTVMERYRKLCEDNPRTVPFLDQHGGLQQVAERDTAGLVDAQYRVTGDDIYITSFCGEHTNPYVNANGLLSQWRAYGQGGGFAIVFNTAQLEELLIQQEAPAYSYEPCHMSDVVYSDDENRFQSELGQSVSDIADYITELFTAILARREEPDATKAYPAFVECISRYKHRGFNEENEVRIVAVPTPRERYPELLKKRGSQTLPEKPRRFRSNGAGLIQYIELFSSLDITLPIERIIVGPHRDKQIRASTISEKVRDRGIEVTISDIPFLG
jgi:DUF2971 family protein